MNIDFSKPVFEKLLQTAKETGKSAFLVGGYVRDIIIDRPSKDIDVVVVGSGIDFADHFASLFSNKPETAFYKNFGTALVKTEDWEVEFVGARKESYQSHTRKPQVEEGTLVDDLSRRDFTINALAMSLNPNNVGELIDMFDGLSDLKNQIIRTPLDPEITFSDDPLRMMRAIRFASQLNFRITDECLAAIQTSAHRISIISKERIADELNKIILSDKPSVGFKLLFNTGLLHLIFPEMTALYGIDKIDGKAHKDNFYHTLQVLDNICVNTKNLWLRWSAILHDIAKPATKRFEPEHGWTFHGHEDRGAKMVPTIFKKLKLPLNEKMKYVQKLVRLHLRPIALSKEIITDSAVRRLLFEAGDDIDDLMTLCEADITSKNQDKVIRYLQNFQLVRQKLKEIEEKDKVRNWQPPVTGLDIMETFDLKPSMEIGTMKNAMREAIIEGEIQNDFHSAYTYILDLGSKLGFKPVKLLTQSIREN